MQFGLIKCHPAFAMLSMLILPPTVFYLMWLMALEFLMCVIITLTLTLTLTLTRSAPTSPDLVELNHDPKPTLTLTRCVIAWFVGVTLQLFITFAYLVRRRCEHGSAWLTKTAEDSDTAGADMVGDARVRGRVRVCLAPTLPLTLASTLNPSPGGRRARVAQRTHQGRARRLGPFTPH